MEYLLKRGIVTEEAGISLRRDLVASGLLHEAGKYTISAQVGETNLEGLKRCFVEIADRMEALISRQ